MLKFCIVLLITAIAHLGNAQIQNTTCPTSCGPFECGPTGEKVWSIVNRRCRHWPNQCQFDSENCTRQSQCKKALVATSQETCIKRCRRFCTRIYRPLCASFLTEDQGQGAFNIKKVTFNNRCLFNRHVCESGESLGGTTKQGVCDQEKTEMFIENSKSLK